MRNGKIPLHKQNGNLCGRRTKTEIDGECFIYSRHGNTTHTAAAMQGNEGTLRAAPHDTDHPSSIRLHVSLQMKCHRSSFCEMTMGVSGNPSVQTLF